MQEEKEIICSHSVQNTPNQPKSFGCDSIVNLTSWAFYTVLFNLITCSSSSLFRITVTLKNHHKIQSLIPVLPFKFQVFSKYPSSIQYQFLRQYDNFWGLLSVIKTIWYHDMIYQDNYWLTLWCTSLYNPQLLIVNFFIPSTTQISSCRATSKETVQERKYLSGYIMWYTFCNYYIFKINRQYPLNKYDNIVLIYQNYLIPKPKDVVFFSRFGW